MQQTTEQKIIREIREILIPIIGEAYISELTLDSNSRFSGSIELDSVEYSKLFEALINKYPDVPFVDWFASKSLEELMELTMGDVAVFISNHVQ